MPLRRLQHGNVRASSPNPSRDRKGAVLRFQLRLFTRPARLDIMGSMKRLAFLFSCSAALACAADLSNVHNVYLLKMTKGLDQYLANRLTGDHVFQVVTDPK